MTANSDGLVKAVKMHPVEAAAIAGGGLLGVALLGKAANTAAEVVTIKPPSGAASDVVRAVRGPAKRERHVLG